MFRAQPPFLRPRAIYTQRVVQKAIEAVYHDRMAMRCVPDRLARDFWVKPAEKMVRLWCRAFADQIDFAIDYQPWVVANFSGILCVDEVYQGELALLLAVDPAAPDGDRLVGYTLLSKTREVDQGMVKAFVDGLRTLGLRPTRSSLTIRGYIRPCWPTRGRRQCINCACSTPLVGLSTPSMMSSNRSGDRCRRHHRPADRRCSAVCVARRRQLTSMMQTPNGIAGAWHGARWASPRPMPCTNTSPPLGPSGDNSASTTAPSASGSN